MITLIVIGAVVVWFIFGWFAARMSIAYDEGISGWSYLAFFGGTISFFIAMFILAIESCPEDIAEALFLDRIPFKPSKRLQEKFFAMNKSDS